MRHAIPPLLFSAVLHVLGLALSGFAVSSLFLLFPAALYTVLCVGLWRGVTAVAWIALICMIGGAAGTAYEFAGPLMAPAPVLIGIILADLTAGTLLARALIRRTARTG
ncbi:MAG: hypothetical protein AAGM84_14470 [Pseudomonadota bacterium]